MKRKIYMYAKKKIINKMWLHFSLMHYTLNNDIVVVPLIKSLYETVLVVIFKSLGNRF